MAAGPLAGTFLKSMPTRHQMPPPEWSVHPERNRAAICASAAAFDTIPARCARASAKSQPGDVVVERVQPVAQVAPVDAVRHPPHALHRGRLRLALRRVDEAVQQVRLPPVVPVPEQRCSARAGQPTTPSMVPGSAHSRRRWRAYTARSATAARAAHSAGAVRRVSCSVTDP